MELLAKGGLAALGLLVPLVVLYILKIKRERRRISSTWLWAGAQRDLMAKSPFKRLVPQLPLLLQAIVLIALAVALARPATRGRELVGDHLAIVLDASASMSATADGSLPGPEVKTRMDAARDAARRIVDALGPGSDAMVLEAGREATIVSPLDRDRGRLRAAIDRVQARDVEGDLGAAIALAVDRLRQLGGSRRILVVTDNNLARPAALSGASLPIELLTVGVPVDNAAIVRVDVRSGTDAATGREQVQAFLIVANFGARPRDLFVTLRQENASDVLASRRVLVGPNERLPVVLTFEATPGDYGKGLVLDASPHDAMPVDDVAYARIPAEGKLPAFLAAPDGQKPSPWLERALASDPKVELRAGPLSALLAAQGVSPDAFVVIEKACPQSPPGGDLLIVDPPAGKCFGTLVGRTLEHPIVTSWDTADARMRFVSLDGVYVKKASALQPDGASQELIRTQAGTIATDISTPTRSATLLGFDVGESDWPLKASYVLFMRNLLEQARAHRAHGITGPARAGEPMRASVPVTATTVVVEGPGADKQELPVRNGLAVVPHVQRIGLYHLSWQGPQAGSRVVPANLTSEAESRLVESKIGIDPGRVDVSSAADQAQAHHEWGWLLALVALAFIVADVWWFTRPVRPVVLGQVKRPERPEPAKVAT